MQTPDQMKHEIDTEYADLLGAAYPAFSDTEMARRHRLMEDTVDRLNFDALVIVEALRAGTATGWATGWPVTAEAVTLVAPGRQKRLYVQHFNHLSLARKIAHDTEVSWGEGSGVLKIAQLLKDEGAQKIGVIGRLTSDQYGALASAFNVADANREYTRMRLVKSVEEIRWLRLAAALTDLGIAALADGARPGVDERQLGAMVEAPYLPYGATNLLHYFMVTPMADPAIAVPAQYASTRRLATGDVLSTEISADFWGYTGQVLRTFFIDAEPTALFAELHAVADAAFDAITAVIRPGAHAAEIVEASRLIEDAGFTIIDDLAHGYGGGYLPPVLGSRSRTAAGGVPDITLEAGMALVVQPNVVTTNGSAGVQTGHLVLVTENGAEPLQAFPRGYKVL